MRRASYASADGREGFRATRQAFDYYERNGDGPSAARVALVPKPGLSGNNLAKLLERALALTDEDSEQYAILLTALESRTARSETMMPVRNRRSSARAR